MAKRFTEKEFEGMKKEFLEGKSYKEIGQHYGRSESSVAKKFLKTGANKLFNGVEKNCKGCNKTFVNKDRRNMHNRLFCSSFCKDKYYKEYTAKYERLCTHCNKSFRTWKYESQHCSVECLSESRRSETKTRERERKLEYNRTQRRVKIFLLTCEECGMRGYSKSERRYCSGACESESMVHRIKCRECGQHKTVSIRRNVYCSKECSNKFANRRRWLRRRNNIELNGDAQWDISIERLMKRDGSKCYLCDKNVFVNEDTNHELYPSIEHIKPLAKGGTHTWDNVKLAHRKCNWEKGTKVSDSNGETHTRV